jgi:hypothetical protein
MNSITDAQQDMREAYYGGAPGVISSGTAWLIAGRYLTFSTLYGRRLYWIFAASLVISGWVLLATKAPTFSGAFVGAIIEYCFGAAIFVIYKREQPNK